MLQTAPWDRGRPCAYNQVKPVETETTGLSDEELEEILQRPLAKGSEVHQILHSNEWDALLVSAHCRDPSNPRQLLVFHMLLGLFAGAHPVERNRYGYVAGGPKSREQRTF